MNIKIVVIAVLMSLGRMAFCDEINDAAREGDLAKVKALLKEDPDWVSSAFFDGWTPLDEAADNGYYEMAKVLVANKADVNVKAKGGRSPLYLAVMYDHADIVKLLLESGANANIKDENGVTPLHLAAWSGYENEAKLLLAHGADVAAKDHNGETPLDWAMEHGNKEMIMLLQR
jgi:ankyrin repeat protein